MEVVEKKAFYKSKTFWVGLGVVLLPVVDSYVKDIGIDDPRIIGFIGILTTVLRFFSSSAIGTKDGVQIRNVSHYRL